MARKPTAVIRDTLEEYATRGVLRGFTHRETPDGRTEFLFGWVQRRPFRVVYDDETRTLRVDRFLPAVPAGSALHADLERFVASRASGTLPPHRAVDPKRARLELSSQDDEVSLSLAILRNQYRYGVRRLLNVVSEIFVLLNASHQEYMWEQFEVPME